jgi:hypothetical protein
MAVQRDAGGDHLHERDHTAAQVVRALSISIITFSLLCGKAKEAESAA